MEGVTVQYPLDEHVSAKATTAANTNTILGGEVSMEDYYLYKREPVFDGAYPELQINPNYIFVAGRLDHLADLFIKKHPGTKLNVQNAKTELGAFFRGSKLMRAHLLPLVAPRDGPRAIKILVAIERHRAELWNDPRCVSANVPLAIPSRCGVYLLVEALLDSPMALVRRTLDHLCCEGTPTLRVALPIAHSHRAPHILRVYDAVSVPGRVLTCSNPVHTLNAENPFIADSIKCLLALRRFKDATITWTATSEVESIARYFADNGIRSSPHDYTAAAIQRRMVENSPGARSGAPTLVVADLDAFDKATREMQRADEANFTATRRDRASTEPPHALTPFPPWQPGTESAARPSQPPLPPACMPFPAPSAVRAPRPFTAVAVGGHSGRGY